MVYAVFTGDPHYHLVVPAAGSKTLCDLSTKGSIKNVREPRLPARVTLEKPPHLRTIQAMLALRRSAGKNKWVKYYGINQQHSYN